MSAPALGDALRRQRRAALRRHPVQTGLDFVEVTADGSAVLLHFVAPAPEVTASKRAIPAGITPANVRIAAALGGGRLAVLSLGEPHDGGDVLRAEVARPQGAATTTSYTLTLVDLPAVDALFDRSSFSFEVDEPSLFDCGRRRPAAAEALPVPEIDYLAKDYASFRKLMLDRLSSLIPGWREHNPADWTVAAVEAIAAAADHLSYFQDAVATEAYLGTARRRISVRRHARLLDYPMHEGCTARAWVCFRIDGASPVLLDRGAQLLTAVEEQPLHIAPGSQAYTQALAAGPEVFETLHPAELVAEHNELPFYTWGARELWLAQGSTSATLLDPGVSRRPIVGDVLLFEEIRGATTGEPYDADPEHRHAVRLTRVTPVVDPLGGQPDAGGDGGVALLEIEWHVRDALPFSLCVASVAAGGPVSVARGNVVLAEHGRTIAGEDLEPVTGPENRRYRPLLERRGLSHAVPYDDAAARSRPAAEAVVQDPRAALPVLRLHEAGTHEVWVPRRDLLASDRFARELVVEMADDGSARLRFGDGVRGRRPAPGTRLAASYRIGGGVAGNVGRESIGHLVVAKGVGEVVLAVRNPLAARGGVEPEPIEQVGLYAPHAFRAARRGVTEDDYAAAALHHPEVTRAAAMRDWGGSWPVMRVAVERYGGRPVDTAFSDEVRGLLERFRLAGVDLQVRGPRWVPVEIALNVHVEPDRFRSSVAQALLEAFSNVELPDGRRGFFHRLHLVFGEPLYLGRVVAAAMAVPGVTWVEATRFHPIGQAPLEELETGRIDVGSLAIVRLDNDPGAPENGTLELTLEGGR